MHTVTEHCSHPADNSHSNLCNCVMLTPTAQHKLCLETSFTNLQHQLEQRAVQPAGSKASSIAGSIFGRSQLSSTTTPYDISSVLDDSIATVTMRKSPCSMLSETTTTTTAVVVNVEPSEAPRLRAVAFDMAATPPPLTELQPLARQHSERKPRSLPLTQALRRASVSGQGVDLLHDDWYGLAPLASPETLSEISSVSSRSSVPISLANSIERYLQQMGVPKVPLEDIFESQLHTPKVMRRAPKFSENLSGCAEDNRNLDQYKRLGRVFVTFPRIFPEPGNPHQLSYKHSLGLDSNSSDDSFESAHSLHRLQLPATVACAVSSKSADQLDEARPTPIKKLTFSDSNILAEEHCQCQMPQCPCRADGQDCCTRPEHHHQQCALAEATATATVGSSDTNSSFYSANSHSSLDHFATPSRLQSKFKLNGDHSLNEIIIRPGVLESHFPVFGGDSQPDAETPAIVAPASPLPIGNGSGNDKGNSRRPDVVGGRVRKRLSSEEFVYARGDDLPILVQIGDRSRNGSPSTRKQRRGCCVYPVGNSIRVAGAEVDAAAAAAAAAAFPTSISKYSRTRVAASAASAKKGAAGINSESNV